MFVHFKIGVGSLISASNSPHDIWTRKHPYSNLSLESGYVSRFGERLYTYNDLRLIDVYMFTPVAGSIFGHFALSWMSRYELGYEIISRFCK